MEIAYLPISKLRPAAYNPRRLTEKQYNDLAESFTSLGTLEPAVINTYKGRENIIISGHQRIKVAERLGMKEYPCFQVSFPEEKEREANIRMNRNTGEWDFDILANDFEVKDLLDWGFNPADFPSTDPLKPTDGLTDPDDVPETPKEPITKPGDVYVLGNHRLMCGSSTVATDVEKLLDGNRPHLMVTDPPYGVEYDADWRNKARRKDGSPIGGKAIGKVENDDNADWTEAWALFEGEVAYVWHAGLYSPVVAESLQKCDFEPRALIIWAKSNFAIGRGHYHHKHEPCWYMVKKGGTGHWVGDRKQTTVWEIDKPQKSETGHSTQKPVECMAKPIENNSLNGDMVYDPFLGSGTTMIACEKLGRKCLGMELNPAYCDVIVKRWETFTGKKAELLKAS